MNATDKAEALRLLDDMDTAASWSDQQRHYERASVQLRSLLSAQGEAAMDRDMALAMQWARDHCGDAAIRSTIEEALCAYDPAKVGAVSVVRKEAEPSAEYLRRAMAGCLGVMRCEEIEQVARELARKGVGNG